VKHRVREAQTGQAKEELSVGRTRVSRSERDMRLMTERYVRQSIDLPQYQSRTCNHCGRRTTFALQDRAGWYACIQCGRFA